MKTESIIFDLDGTLWDSSESVAACWDETVKNLNNPLLRNVSITGETLRGLMGLTMDEIAARLFPQLSVSVRTEILERCSENENNFLSLRGGVLYDRTEETLKSLSEKHRLFIVSNCQCGYIETFFECTKLERYFTDYLCWGETGKPKSGTILELMKKNRISEAAYVGDTVGDCLSAFDAGIPFVHAAYGFGRDIPGDKTAAAAESISALLEIFA